MLLDEVAGDVVLGRDLPQPGPLARLPGEERRSRCPVALRTARVEAAARQAAARGSAARRGCR